jgi:hypothetical protein
LEEIDRSGYKGRVIVTGITDGSELSIIEEFQRKYGSDNPQRRILLKPFELDQLVKYLQDPRRGQC